MTDTELSEIKAKHFPAGVWGCRKCGLTPADAQCEAQELLAEVERLRGVVEAGRGLRGVLLGHQAHWHRTMMFGEGCDLCIAQRAKAREFDAALAELEAKP